MPEPTSRSRQGTDPSLPESVTMPLLSLISRQALDEDYRRTAQARLRRGEGPSQSKRYAVAATVLVFGVLAATAAIQQSRDEEVNDAGRATLISRITTERERVSALQDRVVELREANRQSAAILADTVDAAEAATNRVRRLRLSAGFVAVTGPGVEVTLSNPANADPNQVVYDSDLALLVNALWSAGAEAVSVNGQRLTARSSIRNSGVPIGVNSVGLEPPYLIKAVGDRRNLQANFFDTSSGLAFADLARNLNFSYEFTDEEEVSLPGGPGRYLDLRRARPAQDDPAPNRGEAES